MLPWPKITNFHNVRKSTHDYPELLNNRPEVTYRAKIKLDGTNAGIKILSNGTVIPQSRTQVLENGADNMGFAAWVRSQLSIWSTLAVPDWNITVFGEFVGKGVQDRTAVSQVSPKIFAVFAMVCESTLEDEIKPSPMFYTEPKLISEFLAASSIPQTHVLPWYCVNDKPFELTIDWSKSAEELQLAVEPINQQIALVEQCDPWVKETFGISGLGEGLVFYPYSHSSFQHFSDLGFKAKGEEHKMVKKQAPAQVSPTNMASIEEFASAVLTSARLEQGARAIYDGKLQFDVKLTGKFIAWICKDVETECQAELAASNLTWKQVSKMVGDLARKWYIEQTQKLC